MATSQNFFQRRTLVWPAPTRVLRRKKSAFMSARADSTAGSDNFASRQWSYHLPGVADARVADGDGIAS
eukprot:4713502-Pyramimonas_sp.AAC.1